MVSLARFCVKDRSDVGDPSKIVHSWPVKASREGFLGRTEVGPLLLYPPPLFSSSKALFIAWDPWDFLLKPFV
jgi:hypothetical protein